MNRILDILKSIPVTILRLINNLDKKTEETIKQAAFSLGFVMLVTAVIVGYMMGKDEARIKDAPLAEYVNDAFRIDISREKDDSSLGKMLESELITESRYSSYRKIQYPSQDIIEQETDDSVFSPSDRRKGSEPAAEINNSIEEGKYRPLTEESKVSPLTRRQDKSIDESLVTGKDATAESPKKTKKDNSTPAPSLMIDEGVVE